MAPHYLPRNRQAVPSLPKIVRTDTRHGRTTIMNELITRYLACWNETDPDLRRKLIDETWAPDAQYTDPMVDVRGRDGIDATIAAVQAQFPGFVFTPHGAVDAHHQQARFGWGLGPDGAEPLVIGFDVAVADDDGRLSTVLGFLDKVPS
jgi:SnoaL-like domain